ncbi:TauD/TfdA family dioxygenase [Actinocrinis puniceicyclus]|uniref:TauD/TfdA family dioxygenase n=1 Tax=Actinocrinis puniceicyclus TaxID=977794 RepID=A0A8J7WP54_9ACTN|nr:guanitoxin biosynthesis L-enduracididine beta-hydroxylase GntD [Actinocrinis puniceicyclus]MBS2965966.1 TauD/TfdA family dioxygenase [Actinocrinis puniceicyclus]
MSADWPSYELGTGEVEQILDLAGRVAQDPGEPEFYDLRHDLREQLPAGLRGFLEEFRRTEPAAACTVYGLPIDDAKVGPTPAHWANGGRTPHAREVEVYLALCGMALGEPFTWSTLQASRMIQNIVPIPGDELRQNGHSSDSLLEFHTEDGFHPHRCDYLLLFGVRNEDKVATTVASVRDVRLSAQHVRVLSRRRFHILPDDEHVRQLALRDPGNPALELVRQMVEDPEPVAVLFGDPANPYLRVDLPFTRCVGDDPVSGRALAALMAQLEDRQFDIVVERGSLLVVDNYLAVHGRRPFSARYDGTDRWLKKLTVSRNLRVHNGSPSARSPRVLI